MDVHPDRDRTHGPRRVPRNPAHRLRPGKPRVADVRRRAHGPLREAGRAQDRRRRLGCAPRDHERLGSDLGDRGRPARHGVRARTQNRAQEAHD